MPDNDQQDTEAAPTTEASPETTEPPPASHAEQAHAWSVDETDELSSPARHGWIVSAGLVVLVASVAGAAIWLAATGFGHHSPTPVEHQAVPAPTTTVTAVPPPAPEPTR